MTATKHASTFVLKAVLVIIGLVVLAFCVFSFVPMLQGALEELPQYTPIVYLGLICFYAAALPFFFALLQAFTLLQNIDRNNAFSESSVKALRSIKFSAIAMTVFYAGCMPLVFIFSDLDDAPGGIVFGAAFAAAPLIVATFAAVLQKLIRSGIDMKTENDLTI